MKTTQLPPDAAGAQYAAPLKKSTVLLHPRLLHAAVHRTHQQHNTPVRHDFLEISFIRSGSGELSWGEAQNQQVCLLQRGDIVICNPAVLHGETPSAGEALEMISLGIQDLNPKACPERHFVPGDAGVFHTDGPLFDFFSVLFSRIITECETEKIFSGELAQSITRIIMVMILRFVPAAGDQYVKSSEAFIRAKEFIDQKYLQIRNIDSLCNDVFISKSHLMFLFKRYSGKTPLQYIIEKKMEMAKALLADSGMVIHDVAARCGYEDTNYFYKLFKRHTGMTPMEYRVKARQGL